MQHRKFAYSGALHYTNDHLNYKDIRGETLIISYKKQRRNSYLRSGNYFLFWRSLEGQNQESEIVRAHQTNVKEICT